MSNEIQIRVTSKNDTSQGFTDVERGTDRLTQRAKELGIEFEKTSAHTDDFGRRLQGSNTYAGLLTTKIGKLREETRLLGAEFNRTGDVSILEKLFNNQNAEHELQDLKTKLTSAFGGAGIDAGIKFGDTFKDGFVGGLGDMAMAAAPVLAPVAVLLAAELLAAVGGAIGGGAGIGGILAGSITQAKTNPQVRAAVQDLGHWFIAEWTADTASFAAPTEDAIRLLKTELRGPMSDLRKDFEVISPYTRDFANSLGIAAQKFMPGLNALLQNSGPLIEEAGRDVEMLAEAGSRFLTEVSAGGKGEAEALDTLVRALAGAITFTGELIHSSAELYDSYVHVAEAIAYVLQNFTVFGQLVHHVMGIDVVGYVKGIGSSFDDSGPKVESFSRSVAKVGLGATLTADDFASLDAQINATAKTSDVLAGAMSDKIFNSLVAADKATLGLHQSATRLAETLAKNGRAIDSHTHLVSLDTAAGQANREAVLARVEANIRQYDTDIAAGVAAGTAAASYDANTQALERQLRKAGYTADQINNLIGKYKNVPDKVDTNIATYGLTAAIDGLSELLSLITGVQSQRQVDIDIRKRIDTNFGHASGGAWGGLTTIAEQGRELVRLPQGSMVLSNPDTERVLASAPRGYDGASAGGERTVWAGPGVDSAFISYVQRLVATGQLKIT